MAARIEVASLVPDTRAQMRSKQLQSSGLATDIPHLEIIDVYTIDKKISPKKLSAIADMLTHPVTHTAAIITEAKREKRTLSHPFAWAIEIGFLPGVTDNIGMTTKQMIEDLLTISFSSKEGVYSSQVTLLSGNISQPTVEKIAQSLANPLIQRIHVTSFSSYTRHTNIFIPHVKLHSGKKTHTVPLNISDEALTILGKRGVPNPDGTRRGPLALDMTYMKAIQSYFHSKKRPPTDIELESIAQTWSEHCKHTIFANAIDDITDGLYRTYIKGATRTIRQQKGKDDMCVSVFTDNAGAITFDKDYLITDKVETHNSPSALDPFGGAITGIVGVNRDALGFGMGAKPVANRYGFCFADPHQFLPLLFRSKGKKDLMLPPKRIMEGVIAGVNAGGNQSGIPTMDGFLYFDEHYQGKPLIFVGTVGLIPRRVAGKQSHKKKAQPGDYIVMIGGRVGADGIHGATFSSEELDSGSPATAVQIGDPITQKKMSDLLTKEARDKGLYSSITDNGAGGLSCSVAEMARECGGCRVDLEKVPLKYPGLAPWQIWISESQERMTLAVPKQKWKQLAALCKRRDVEATVIGTFTHSGHCIVRYQGKTVMDIEMEFLHNGLPSRSLFTKQPKKIFSSTSFSPPSDENTLLHTMLSRPSIASYAFVSEQFDHTVQGGAVLGPLQGRGRVNAEATVFRPLLTSPKGVVLSHGLYPSYSAYDTYHMAACSIDGAIRAAVATGANPDQIALLDNFCWCSATDPTRLYELKRAAEACYDYAVAYGTPYIAGKDSMFNDFKGYTAHDQPVSISIPPTLLISTLSVIADHTTAVSLDAKIPGDLVYILGETHEELGGSEYYRLCAETERLQGLAGHVPRVDAARNQILYRTLHQAINKQLISSAISISRGGIAIALAKKAIAGKLGMHLSMTGKIRTDHILFSESSGRILVTINPKNKDIFEKKMQECAYVCIGTIRDDSTFTIAYNNKQVIQTTVEQLHQSYTQTFKGY